MVTCLSDTHRCVSKHGIIRKVFLDLSFVMQPYNDLLIKVICYNYLYSVRVLNVKTLFGSILLFYF